MFKFIIRIYFLMSILQRNKEQYNIGTGSNFYCPVKSLHYEPVNNDKNKYIFQLRFKTFIPSKMNKLYEKLTLIMPPTWHSG